MNFPIEIVLSVLGIAVATATFLLQFVLVGRKRVGYRVQMDTPVTGETESVLAGALHNLTTGAGGNEQLARLSLVLVRIENAGSLRIGDDDYVTRTNSEVGLHLVFPERKVIGLAVNELSNGVQRDNFDADSALAQRDEVVRAQPRGIIDLPKVPLERGQHYKILAVLRRETGSGEPEAPFVEGSIKGGSVAVTESNSGPSKKMLALCGFLVAVVVVQLVLSIVRPDPKPSYCADGNLTLVGSTAMEKMVREAAKNYETHCSGAGFTFDFVGTSDGLRVLDKPEPAPDTVAIGEGPKRDTFPDLFETPFAVAPFAVVTHPGLGIADLSTAQIQRLFRGEIDNWRMLGGPDLPVVVVDRQHGSGSRYALEARLLDWQRPLYQPEFCAGRSRLVHCEVGSTGEMAEVVAATPGAVGYLEATTVGEGLRAVTIDGQPATETHVADRSYPFYSVEFAFHDYPGGDMPAGSLAAKFVDYLVYGDGRLVVAEFGGIACLELARRSECEP
ncbi:substrate-binding domain-containing protein [Nocardia rosealba]|uniref:substrate-binding domain-containing protein n=1 Tax=Nocardia rosealba TaxID=2878563 RepID=UPI001CD9524F|nr:substrate-binding domain-containing protein [Nocardia rosealba]MCA2206726.1 substrate-binding domain-containing protein [Nocardia rosealba]